MNHEEKIMTVGQKAQMQREKAPALSPASDGRRDEILLQVSGLQKYFPIQKGFLRRVVGQVNAVDGVDFYIKRGETFGLVGESGCGKTTTGRCTLRAIEPSGGQIMFNDETMGWVDVRRLDEGRLKVFRRHTQMIFQDPYSSLNPRMTLLESIGEPLYNNGIRGGRLTDRVAELLEMVGLRPEYIHRYPHAFSGGQRQRIGIARALALNPQFVVCDEPVSALDVSIQAQTLNLLQDLQEAFGLTYLFVAHQLNVVEHICDRVAVMYVGKLVEMANTEALFYTPLHPYTEALLGAVPRPDPDFRDKRVILEGEIANPANPPSGCYFHPRCPYAVERCKSEEPVLREVRPEHYVKCHLAEELTLNGVVAD
jgi:peptide/nickel transport system ATP-binding protein